MTVLYLAVGGAIGTIARHYAAERVGAWADAGALGIFTVNVAGSFLIGLFFALGADRFEWSNETRLLVATGFLGGFTTFSALAWQTREFIGAGDLAAAALNVTASIVAGMLAVYAGDVVGRAV